MKAITKKTTIGLVACIVALIGVLSVALVACNGDKSGSASAASSFVTVDINPSVELVLDQNNIVMSVAAANSDAEVLLWNENGIVGANIDVAVGKIASLAVEYGYISDENNNISVSVSASVNEDELYTTVSTALVNAINTLDNTINATVEKAVDIVLEKELDQIKTANAGKSGYDDTLTVARYRLVKRAMAADRTLKMDTAVNMTNAQLSAIVETAQADAKAKFGKAYQLAISEAQFAYETFKQKTYNTVYVAYCREKKFESINSAMNFSVLHIAYTCLDHYYYTLRDYLDNPIYTSNDLQNFYNSLATYLGGADYEQFKEQITDINGNITAESLGSYINKLYRNLPENQRAAFETVYESAKSVLDNIDVTANIDDAGIISEITSSLNSSLVSIGFTINFKQASSIELALAVMQTKLDALYAAMNLTDEDLEAIKEKQSELASEIAQKETAMKEKIETARSQAEALLTQLKEARLQSSEI